MLTTIVTHLSNTPLFDVEPYEAPKAWTPLDLIDFLPGPTMVRVILALVIVSVVVGLGRLALSRGSASTSTARELAAVGQETSARPSADLD